MLINCRLVVFLSLQPTKLMYFLLSNGDLFYKYIVRNLLNSWKLAVI